jgi:hypothetical protein
MRPTSTAAALVQTPTKAARLAGALHAVERSDRHDGVITRADRIRFWIYVAMGALCMAVLVAAAITATAS